MFSQGKKNSCLCSTADQECPGQPHHPFCSSQWDMAEQVSTSRDSRLQYMLGLFEGLIAGIGFMIMFHRIISPAKATVKETSEVVGKAISAFREHGTEIPLKRESGEAAGDPAQLVTANADQTKTQFERAGGSPGPNARGEVLDRPGHPGQPMPRGDASEPVQPSPRSIKIS